ncbi:MAG: CPBP family intramembrane glutamic endopeptidase [Bacteroidota bacterium]|nr:CPBP family intramembrane glutamic endopeptidase [Bacteroidota bacterium]
MNIDIKKVVLFIGLTFSLCWSMVALFFAFGGNWNTTVSFGITTIYMFLPMIVVICVQKFIYKESLKKPLEISFNLNRWFAVAWLLPPVIAFATLGVSLLFPGVEYSSEMAGMFERFKSLFTPEQLAQMESQTAALPIHPIWFSLLQGLVAGVTINAIFGFGEELGWRGLLQRELGLLGFWKSSLTIGVIWGIWHVPIILQGHNYPEHPVAGVFMMTIWCILLAPIFSCVRLKANSVIAAAIFHGSINATAGLAVMVIKGGNDLLIGVTGLAGFIVLIILNIGLLIYDKFLTNEPIIIDMKP